MPAEIYALQKTLYVMDFEKVVTLQRCVAAGLQIVQMHLSECTLKFFMAFKKVLNRNFWTSSYFG